MSHKLICRLLSITDPATREAIRELMEGANA